MKEGLRCQVGEPGAVDGIHRETESVSIMKGTIIVVQEVEMGNAAGHIYALEVVFAKMRRRSLEVCWD